MRRLIRHLGSGLRKTCPKLVMSCRWRHLIGAPTVAPMSEPPRPPGEYGVPSDPNSNPPPYSVPGEAPGTAYQPPTSGGGYAPPPSSGAGYQQPGYDQPGYQQPGYQQPGHQQPRAS